MAKVALTATRAKVNLMQVQPSFFAAGRSSAPLSRRDPQHRMCTKVGRGSALTNAGSSEGLFQLVHTLIHEQQSHTNPADTSY